MPKQWQVLAEKTVFGRLALAESFVLHSSSFTQLCESNFPPSWNYRDFRTQLFPFHIAFGYF